MDVVVHPVNDRFLTRVVFPALEQGSWQAGEALARLSRSVLEPSLRYTIERLLDKGAEGGFTTLEAPLWFEVIYKLLFQSWTEDEEGWQPDPEPLMYAAPLDEALHVALMLEDDEYPYADPRGAKRARAAFLESPAPNQGLASLLCGAWSQVPKFQPDLILSTQGRAKYAPKEGVAVSDWGYRSASAVMAWNAGLPAKLTSLVEREKVRLSTVELPEANELLEHWLGNAAHPPAFSVAFSGLGPEAAGWMREVGAWANLIRTAAKHGRGLTSLVTRGVRTG